MGMLTQAQRHEVNERLEQFYKLHTVSGVDNSEDTGSDESEQVNRLRNHG